jgi:large subunit ribosomal protein L6
MTTNVTTSRIGRKPIVFSPDVYVKIQGSQFLAKGPRGQLVLNLHRFTNVTVENNTIHVQANQDELNLITGSSAKLYKSIVGTTRANINNIILGVTTGYEKKLLLIGVGYRAKIEGNILSLSLGHSFPVNFHLPEGVTAEVASTATEIIIKGSDKRLVGETAAQIRRVRPVEPYKGKGVRYANEKVELKETKKK